MKVKYFRVEGRMLISHDRFPRWQKFKKEVRAVKPEDAIEKIYSELGSKHKLKRAHIRVESVKEISRDEVTDPLLLQFENITRVVVIR